LAERLRVMREALEGVKEIAESVECPACGASIGEHVNGGYYDRDADWICYGKSPGGTEDVVWQVDAIRKMQAALALTPTEAEAQAAANAEKAALLDWYADGNQSKVQQLSSNDPVFDRAWSYAAGKGLVSRKPDGSPMTFLDALRAAKEKSRG
jgi:hypothetical protein